MQSPILLNNEEKPIAVLSEAYDIIVKMEMLTKTNGFETLEFKIPYEYDKRSLVLNEGLVEVNSRVYVIKVVDDTKASDNVTMVQCDATWYDLADGSYKNHTALAEFTARQAIDEQLVGMEWTSGTVEIDVPQRFTISQYNTPLYNLRYINSVFGGDMWFDTKNKTVNLYQQMGVRTNNIFSYRKNISSIKRTVDTRNLVTRFKMVGKDGVDISSVNNGVPYVENYSYYDNRGEPRKVKTFEKKDERFTNKQYLKWYMEQWLSQNCMPTTSYAINISVFKEVPNLGDLVYVIDEDMGVKSWLRIVSLEVNVKQPWLSTAVLESLSKDISDILNDESQSLSTENVSSTISDSFSQMSPYNLLLNSRADDGLSYWESSGFEVDDEVSVSGYSSFKTLPGSGTERRLKQTVYPNTAFSYVVSAQVQAPDGYEYETTDRVGIEVVIHYEDGTTQTEFVSFFGIFEEEEEPAPEVGEV